MIESWASYALSDFLMFSPASYFRRFELANAELWPAQVLLIAMAGLLVWLTGQRKPQSGLWIALILAIAWGLTAGVFLHRHYAQINLAADWMALGFLIEALMLFGFALCRACRERVFGHSPVNLWHPGMLLLLYSLLVHPLVGLIAGRNWQGIELFGIAPDATVLATLGILLTGLRKASWVLLPIPLAWCIVSALTYLAMGYVYGAAPLVLSIVALVASVSLQISKRPKWAGDNGDL